jgi:DNA-binding response OmpR family regulator
MLRILVAEDDHGIQTLLRTILAREGFLVDCVDDGAEALARLDSARYDVILVDLMMPRFSGADLIDLLAQSNHDALSRVIVITAAALHDMRTFHRLPVVRKPFDLDELRSRIRSVGSASAAALQQTPLMSSPMLRPAAM